MINSRAFREAGRRLATAILQGEHGEHLRRRARGLGQATQKFVETFAMRLGHVSLITDRAKAVQPGVTALIDLHPTERGMVAIELAEQFLDLHYRLTSMLPNARVDSLSRVEFKNPVMRISPAGLERIIGRNPSVSPVEMVKAIERSPGEGIGRFGG